MPEILVTQPAADAAPVACALSPSLLDARVAGLSALAARALERREPIDGGERLSFTDQPDVERGLRDAIAAEAACCSFLAMRLERRDGALVLEVTGPPEARPLVERLFA